MKKLFAVLIMSSVLLAGCESKKESSSETPASGTAAVTENNEESAAENLIEFRMGESADGELLLTEKDIAKAEPIIMVYNDTSKYDVSITFNENGTTIFQEATEKALEENVPISIWYEGEMIFAPTVTSVIHDGKINVSGDFDADEAAEIAKKICP